MIRNHRFDYTSSVFNGAMNHSSSVQRLCAVGRGRCAGSIRRIGSVDF